MPMGIVSDSDFDSELSNVAVIINPSTVKKDDNQQQPCENNSESTSDSVPTDIPPIQSAEVIDIKSPGRKEGDFNVPESIRKLIGETAAIEGRSAALALGGALGVSPSSVSAYAVGATSTATYNEPDEKLKSYIDTRKKKLSKKALNRLNLAIHHVTRTKLADAKLGEIMNVALGMSHIVKNLAPPEPKNTVVAVENKPVFMLYAPPTKSEDKYDVIHSRE